MAACPACASANAGDARFCSRCGSPLPVASSCPQCGADLPAGAGFCPACGSAVNDGGREERKLVTVLFADVAGSTALGERLDPEHLKQVMHAYFQGMREEIEAEGGTVEKFIGDAVVAAFGVPASHEDDAARAMRAALRMRRRLEIVNEGLRSRFGVTLAARIGVNTGEVVAAASRHDFGMVTGDTVNAAARLQQAAQPGQILVGERTARAGRGFRFRDLGLLTVKGKERPIRAAELMDEQADARPT